MRWWRAGLMCGLLSGLLSVGVASAQSAVEGVPAWQKGAGGTAQFEVASVRASEPGTFTPPSFALSSDASFRDPKGSFQADFGLSTYIEFAYKQWFTVEERQAMLAGLPHWVETDHFLIQARAPLHATKDQYRLMMQDLLRERFGLRVHFENREEPVLAMLLARPDRPGPKLVPHEKGASCDPEGPKDVFPGQCYSFQAMEKDGQLLTGARATTMDLVAKFVGSMGGVMGEVSRPVVDQTGLMGLWDYTLEFARPPIQAGRPVADTGQQGPSMLEAMHDQLGIKLKPTRAVIPVLVVDHVQRPTEN